MPPSQKPRPFVVMFILDFSLNVSAGSQCQMSKGNVFFFTPNTWIGKVITSGPFCGPFPNFAAISIFFSPLPFSFFTFSFIYPPLSQLFLALTLFNFIKLFVLAPFFFLVPFFSSCVTLPHRCLSSCQK